MHLKIERHFDACTPVSFDAVVLSVLSNGEISTEQREYRNLYDALDEKTRERLKKNLVLTLPLLGKTEKHVIFVWLDAEKLDGDSIEKVYARAITELKAFTPSEIAVSLSRNFSPLQACRALETILLSAYQFDKYRSEPSPLQQSSCSLFYEYANDPMVQQSYHLAMAALLARDIVNEPSNVLTPFKIAQIAQETAHRHGFFCRVLEQEEAEEMGMRAFLSVARGSEQRPKLIVMEYKNRLDSKEKIALIGKGLTFDSGGYSIKQNESMLTMKSDMGGAAAVIGAMSALAQNKIKVNVIGIIPACENMLSGSSYRPGDILETMSGKYVEITSTDAEGRLTLADAITYAIREKGATQIVDIATLTGASMIALGEQITAVLTNREVLWERIQEASEKSGEKIWRLPCDPGLSENNKSEIADLKNTGGRYGGCITAGLFLSEFTEGRPWLHLDIAGPSWSYHNTPLFEKGATGAGTRLLYRLLESGMEK